MTDENAHDIDAGSQAAGHRGRFTVTGKLECGHDVPLRAGEAIAGMAFVCFACGAFREAR